MNYMALFIFPFLLAGCAGLNVQWVVTASYNTPATTSTTMTPGVVAPPAVEPTVPAK